MYLTGPQPHNPCLQVTVELKNDLAITGTLHSIDQYLNIKITNTRAENPEKYPHMVSSSSAVGEVCASRVVRPDGDCFVQISVRSCFIRGSVVRYIHLPADGVDVELLHEATRREARAGA